MFRKTASIKHVTTNNWNPNQKSINSNEWHETAARAQKSNKHDFRMNSPVSLDLSLPVRPVHLGSLSHWNQSIRAEWHKTKYRRF